MTRIGILIKEFDTLENWELRIIENIKNDPTLGLALLIKDGRARDEIEQLNRNTFGEFIFNKQVSIEKSFYKNSIIQTVNTEEIFEYLNTIPTIKVKPKRDGSLDIFSHGDSQKVKEYDLDVILKHGFNTINGEMLIAAKQGIWLLLHGDSKKIGSSGFWEVLNKESVVSVMLLQLSSAEPSKGFVIDKAYYNPHRHWSFVQTNNVILESSVSLLFKHIKKIEKGEYLVLDSIVEYSSLHKSPTIYNSVKYGLNFYSILINKFYQKFSELLGKRYECWTLFIGNGNFMEANLSKLKPVKLPKGEFWADPFLFKHQNQQFVFFESLSYKTRKGKISCGLIKGSNIVDVRDVLDLDYHLSYPYIFKEDGEIFMMLETMQNKRLEIYKCISFPDKWVLFTTAFEGEIVADATFFTDQKNIKWLFVTKKVSHNTDSTSELFIYKVDSFKLNNLEPHKQNPVIIDSRVARNGGAIFEYHDKIYRPSQSSTDGIYGKALNINQIKKLTLDEYKEEIVKKVEPNFQKGFMSIHHLHQKDDLFIFDAAYKKK